ncbi:MAG: hypothetical protein IPK82_03350 [Polyangiaceae bacterium]|nr:hypothetical protein [Polyangiaceae bacterium]
MNVRGLACCAVLLGLAGCSGSGSGDEGTTGGAAPPPATTTTTTASALVLVTEPAQAKPGIELRVKAEVDNKPEGITGTTLAVAGTRGSMQTPTGWTTAKGDPIVVASADKKAQIAATSFASGATDARRDAAAASLGLTACEWNAPDPLTIGKNTLSGNGADGLCSKGSAKVKTAYVMAIAEGLLVMGAWEDGGDSGAIFGSMRSIIKVAGGTANDGIAACCAALAQNANSAPLDQKAYLLQAAAICNGLRNNPQGKAALGQVRAALKGAKMPSSCQ